MPSSHRFSDPAEENNILNHAISEDLQKYGFIPEFIGRIPRIVPLHPLSEDDLVRIIQEPEDSLLSQYQRLFSLNQVILQFTNGAIRAVARRCVDGSANGPSDGARGLRRVMEEILEAPQFEVPGGSVRYVLITEDVVNGTSPALYYGREGKDKFHEQIMHEEDEYLARIQKASAKEQPKVDSKSGKQERQREAYGGIP